MDQLDFQIFRSIGFRPYGEEAGDLSRMNPWVIAKKLGANGSTVKLRLNKMKKSGFIRYFQIYPNFRLLGINGAAYLFHFEDVLDKSDLIEKCILIDGVTEVHDFIGTQVCVDFTFRTNSDEARKLELFQRLLRCNSSEKFYDRVMPEVSIQLSSLDWQIIKALRYNALKPLSKVAKELNLTPKTVRRRFRRLARNNAIIIVPFVNPADIPDTITQVMLIYPDQANWKNAVDRVMSSLGKSCFLSRIEPNGNVMLCLAARTLAETEDNMITARRIDGIKTVRMLLYRDMKECTGWLDAAIDRKVADTSAP